jgi:L-asparagine transporter-like permease
MYSYCYVFSVLYILFSSCQLGILQLPWLRFILIFLSCKANARVKLAKTGHGPHCSKLVNGAVLCIVFFFFVLFCVLLCVNVYCTTEPGVFQIAVKYIVSYHIICSLSAWPSQLLYRRGRKSRRDLRITLYCWCKFVYVVLTRSCLGKVVIDGNWPVLCQVFDWNELTIQ